MDQTIESRQGLIRIFTMGEFLASFGTDGWPALNYNEFYAAVDLDMGPLVDLGVSEFESRNIGGHIGLIQGDQIALSASVTNNGAEQHPAGLS